MRGSAPLILITIFKSLSQGRKPVTYGGQKANRKNLERFQDIKIKRSTYYYHRKVCKDNGWINTMCRYKNGLQREIRRRTDMVTVKLKGVIKLTKMGIEGARELRDKYLKRTPSEDERFPADKHIYDGSYRPKDPDERKRLDGLLGIVTKEIS